MRSKIAILFFGMFLSVVGLTDNSTTKALEVEEVIGTGTPRLADPAGVETPLSKGDFIVPGDMLITDENATVDLRMADGSLLRVTPNSSFTVFAIDELEKEPSVIWALGLFRGLVEAVIAKGQALDPGKPQTGKQKIKIEIKTPSAALGVLGTSFSIAEDENEVYIEAVEGEVLVGGGEADFSPGSYVSVKAGEYVDFRRNEGYPNQSSKVSHRKIANQAIANRITLAQEIRKKQEIGVGKAWKQLSEAEKSDIKKRFKQSRSSITKMRQTATVPVGSDVRRRLKWRRSASTAVDLNRAQRGVDVQQLKFPLAKKTKGNDPNKSGSAEKSSTGGNGGVKNDSGEKKAGTKTARTVQRTRAMPMAPAKEADDEKINEGEPPTTRQQNTNQSRRTLEPSGSRREPSKSAANTAETEEEKRKKRKLKRKADRQSGKATVKSKSLKDKTIKSKKTGDKSYKSRYEQ